MLSTAIANTVATVFPGVFLYERLGNTILIATKQAMTLDAINESLEGLEDPILVFLAEHLKDGIMKFRGDTDTVILHESGNQLVIHFLNTDMSLYLITRIKLQPFVA